MVATRRTERRMWHCDTCNEVLGRKHPHRTGGSYLEVTQTISAAINPNGPGWILTCTSGHRTVFCGAALMWEDQPRIADT